MRPFFASTASRSDDFWRDEHYFQDLFDDCQKLNQRVAIPVPSNKRVSPHRWFASFIGLQRADMSSATEADSSPGVPERSSRNEGHIREKTKQRIQWFLHFEHIEVLRTSHNLGVRFNCSVRGMQS